MTTRVISMTLMSGPRDGEALKFDLQPQSETILSFGRRETCDVCLNYDSQVSRNHARLIFDGERFWLEDLDSRNGTFLERQRITERVILKPGKLFRIGRTWLRLDPFASDETQAAEPIPPDDDPF